MEFALCMEIIQPTEEFADHDRNVLFSKYTWLHLEGVNQQLSRLSVHPKLDLQDQSMNHQNSICVKVMSLTNRLKGPYTQNSLLHDNPQVGTLEVGSIIPVEEVGQDR